MRKRFYPMKLLQITRVDASAQKRQLENLATPSTAIRLDTRRLHRILSLLSPARRRV